MLPDNSLSTPAIISEFSFKNRSSWSLLQDWELGGIGLNDPSQGLSVKLWHSFVEINEENIGEVYVLAEGTPKTLLFSGVGITEIALSFDQNMNPFVAYMQMGSPKFYWYDPIEAQMVHSDLPSDCFSLRCTIDDRRQFNISNSDIILAYIRQNALCIRYQRDRYEIEHILYPDISPFTQLISVGMNVGNRLQFRLGNYTDDDPLQANPDFSQVPSGSQVQVPILDNDTYYYAPVKLEELADLPKITRAPISGSVSVNPDGTINFVAPRGFQGSITFEYEIRTPPETD